MRDEIFTWLWRRPAVRHHSRLDVPAAERRSLRQTNRRCLWQRLETALQLLVEREPSRRAVVLRGWQRHAERKNPLLLESQRRTRDCAVALHEEAGADHERHRQRQLAHDDRVAHTPATGAIAPTAAAFTQHAIERTIR